MTRVVDEAGHGHAPRVIRVRRRDPPARLLRDDTRVLPEDARTWVRGECVVRDPEGGVVAVVLRPAWDWGPVRAAVRAVLTRDVVRGRALAVTTRVWGRVPHGRRLGGGTRALPLAEAPGAAATLADLACRLTDLLATWDPDLALTQRMRVPPRYRLGGRAAFTTGSVNASCAVAYHRDGRNAPGTWSAMPVLAAGLAAGGALVLPEWDLALELADGDVVLADLGQTWHGVTPLALAGPDAYRYSLPCYVLDGLARS